MYATTMKCMSEWSEQVVSRFAASMRARRQALKMSIQDVVNRTIELGHPLNRSALSDLENGRRKDRLALVDALVIADVLRIPLGSLLFPDQPDGEVEAYPGVTIDSYTAAHSLTGEELPVPEWREPDPRLDEWLAGAALINGAKLLMDLRSRYSGAQANFEHHIDAKEIDKAERFQILMEELQTRISEVEAEIRSLGGVVNDG